ncbi:MAG: Fe-S cluster assembly protein SufB [Candidatus Magasanikbacteria bacterium]
MSSSSIAKLDKKLIERISSSKNEPDWMFEKRLKGLELFNQTEIPEWGADLSDLDLEELQYFVDPKVEQQKDWEEVPDNIRETFDKLGIPESEKEILSGSGAQYDSLMVYHNLKERLEKQGVVFENMDVAVQKYPEKLRKYFMTENVQIDEHKFAMLHAAVWSGGTFIYVPKNTQVNVPLQAYFRMNEESSGQFEHTIIVVDKGARLRYIEACSAPEYSTNSLHAGCVEIFVKENARVQFYSIENWSKNVYNLNTKRAIIEKNGTMEWITGNMGSKTTMLYPCSVLKGRGASSDSLSLAVAGEGQVQDTGAKAIHMAENTSSNIVSKSISKNGGKCTFRGLIKITDKAKDSTASMDCDSLILDDESIAETNPCADIQNNEVDVSHEAKVGRIGEEEMFYLRSRGLDEEQAKKLLVSGFIEPIVKKLPMEYAVELNKMIDLEMEGAVG